MTSSLFAPAKINLYLHVGALAADGFHPLSSLMVFADVGDRLTAKPAPGLGLEIEGPFSAGLSADGDNLVLRAARALLAHAGLDDAPLGLVLSKNLPLAAGLGGGSSDAGAALRLVREVLELDVTDAALEGMAAELGADGAACLQGWPVIAEGRGERLSAAPVLPPLDAVLVNPGVASPTGAVYRAFDAAPGAKSADRPALPARFAASQDAIEFFARCRNDLEAPAVALNPVIGAVLDTLTAQPQTGLARVSGSGATCFALCGDGDAAQALAARLASTRPDWWVRRCRLGGPWRDLDRP